MKRIISLLLALVLVVGLLPLSVMAATAVTITQQPKSVTVAEGEKAAVTVKATGDGLTYRWYYKDAGASDYTYTSSFTGNTYTIVMNEARNGRRVLCKITDKYGNTVKSNSVVLAMKAATALTITQQPKSVTVAEGEMATVTVKATGDGLTYRWYFKDVGASEYKYTSSFKGNTYSVAMTAERSGRRVLCKITDKYGNTVKTQSVTINMNKVATIVTQPKSVTVAEGEKAVVSVKATGDGLTYRWYYKDAGMSDYKYTSSFKGNTYSVAMNAARDGRRVLCKITDQYGNTVKTKSVTMNMATALTITQQPQSVTVAEGENAAVTVKATGDGLTYEWYFKDAGMSDYKYTSSFKGNTYTVAMNAARDGRNVYCVITDKYGNSITSGEATLSMNAGLRIVTQPKDQFCEEYDWAEFVVEVTGGKAPYTYQWQYRSGTGAFEDETYDKSASESVLCMMNLFSSILQECREYRCVIVDANGDTVISDTAILAQVLSFAGPSDETPFYCEVGDTITFCADVEGGISPYTYTWQYKTADVAEYTNLTDSFTRVSGLGTDELSLTVAQEDFSRQFTYRCVISDAYGHQIETPDLYPQPALKIVTQPKDTAIVHGATGSVTISATGEGLTYAWYYKDEGDVSFIKADTSGSSYSVIMDATVDGRQVYCEVSDKYGKTVKSDTAILSMIEPVTITEQPVSVTVAGGAIAAVTVKAAGDGLSYQWYWKNANATEFSKSTQRTNTYSVTMQESFNGRQVYCIVTDQYGNTVKSDTATLIMRNSVKITQQPVSVTVANGQTAAATVNASGDGLTYQWYWKGVNNTAFSASSQTTNTYSVTMQESVNGRQVYCVVTDKYGNTVRSNTVTLNLKLTIKTQPVSKITQVGNAESFTVAVYGGKAPYTYQWYYVNDTQSTPTKFTGNEFWCTGSNSSTLKINVNSSLTSFHYKYRCVVTDTLGNTVTTNWCGAYPELDIVTQPQSVNAALGETVTFKVEITGGSGDITYTWYQKPEYNQSAGWQELTTVKGNTYSFVVDTLRTYHFDYYCAIEDNLTGDRLATFVFSLN